MILFTFFYIFITFGLFFVLWLILPKEFFKVISFFIIWIICVAISSYLLYNSDDIFLKLTPESRLKFYYIYIIVNIINNLIISVELMLDPFLIFIINVKTNLILHLFNRISLYGFDFRSNVLNFLIHLLNEIENFLMKQKNIDLSIFNKILDFWLEFFTNTSSIVWNENDFQNYFVSYFIVISICFWFLYYAFFKFYVYILFHIILTIFIMEFYKDLKNK